MLRSATVEAGDAGGARPGRFVDRGRHLLISSLLNLPTWLFLAIVVAFSVGLGELLRRLFHVLNDKAQLQVASADGNHLVGYVFGVCGVVYAVVLAFVVVTAWQQFDHAEEVALEEQNAAVSLFIILDPYKDTDLRDVKQELQIYAHSMWADWYVLNRGGALAEEKGASILAPSSCLHKGSGPLWPRDGDAAMKNRDAAAKAAFCIGTDLSNWQPETPSAQADYAASMTRFEHFLNGRLHRVQSSNRHLPGIMWGSLIVGAVVILIFTFLFAEPSSWNQMLRTAALSAMMGIMFAEALVFDHPFIGPNRIDDSHWHSIACLFDERLGVDCRWP